MPVIKPIPVKLDTSGVEEELRRLNDAIGELQGKMNELASGAQEVKKTIEGLSKFIDKI